MSLKGLPYNHSHEYSWKKFKKRARGDYIELKHIEELNEEAKRVREEIGFCQIYHDDAEHML